jgi:hypothetical protein
VAWRSSWRSPAVAAGLVLLVVALAYLPSILAGTGFVSDDFMILQRVRQADGLRGGLSFFGASYYDYYRPLAFLSFAADWSAWRDWPLGYHATSVLLHLANTLLVFFLARRLLGERVAIAAAAIFGLHIVNQEAVFWVSARFDLLATAGALALLLAVGSAGRWGLAGVALLYLVALLSKESAVAMPVAAGAYAWLIRRERTAGLFRIFAWMGAAAVVYLLLRHASGLPSVGGPSRLPKFAALLALPLLQLALASSRADDARRWMCRRRDWLIGSAALVLVASGVLAAASAHASALRAALGSLGFAALHLASPVSVERWLFPLPEWLGLAGVMAGLAAVIAARWLACESEPAFLAFFVVAAVMPVSSMTEGSRYLYLASAPAAMLAAWCVARVERPWPVAARSVLALLLVAFALQVRAKGRDWLWASGMTSRAVATIVGAAGPGCRDAQLVLATAPVRPHGVYANLNHEALAALGDCRPAGLRTIVRTGYDIPRVEAVLEGDRLSLTTGDYTGGFLTSTDLVHYSARVDRLVPTSLTNPLGAFEARPEGAALVIRQSLSPGDATRCVWFVFTGGQIEHITLR